MKVRIVIDASQLGDYVGRELNWNATEAKIRAAIQEHVAAQCAIDSNIITVNVSYSVNGDRVYVIGETMADRDLSADITEALVDFPWYNDSAWAVYE